MSIWRTLIGGAAGFAIGGPLGAILGGVAGHVLDKKSSSRKNSNIQSDQVAFTVAIIVLGAKMAKADGSVSVEEIKAFKEVFHVPEQDMRNVGKIFDEAKKDSKGFEPYASQIAELFKSRRNVLEDLLDGLFHIAKADNILHQSEIDYLRQVSLIFGFNESEFSTIKERHNSQEISDPYKILGIDSEANFDQVKKKYKKLIKEYHPDKLIAQGVPKELIDVANKKISAINNAYDRIEKIHNNK
ncbi:MAG: molecular chaperone DjlA [Rhodospirillaceae bacterium]|nr:molecular chaperone DjlA [Rhodospirillaceae bacterium]